MPNKTKQEKLISQYRKKLKLLQSLQTEPFKTNETKNIQREKKAENQNNTLERQENPDEEDRQTEKFFLFDFRRSLITISFILALEISLYFVSMYNNLRLGK